MRQITLGSVPVADIELKQTQTGEIDRLLAVMEENVRLNKLFEMVDIGQWMATLLQEARPKLYWFNHQYWCYANRYIVYLAAQLLSPDDRIECELTDMPGQKEIANHALMEYLYLPVIMSYSANTCIHQIIKWSEEVGNGDLHQKKLTVKDFAEFTKRSRKAYGTRTPDNISRNTDHDSSQHIRSYDE